MSVFIRAPLCTKVYLVLPRSLLKYVSDRELVFIERHSPQFLLFWWYVVWDRSLLLDYASSSWLLLHDTIFRPANMHRLLIDEVYFFQLQHFLALHNLGMPGLPGDWRVVPSWRLHLELLLLVLELVYVAFSSIGILSRLWCYRLEDQLGLFYGTLCLRRLMLLLFQIWVTLDINDFFHCRCSFMGI